MKTILLLFMFRIPLRMEIYLLLPYEVHHDGFLSIRNGTVVERRLNSNNPFTQSFLTTYNSLRKDTDVGTSSTTVLKGYIGDYST